MNSDILRVKPEYVYLNIESNNQKYWEVYSSNSRTVTSSQNEDIPVDESVDQLADLLSNVQTGQVRVRISNQPFPLKPGQPKGLLLSEYQVAISTGRNRSVGNTDNVQQSTNNNQKDNQVFTLMRENADLRAQIAKQEFEKQLEIIKMEHANQRAETARQIAAIRKEYEEDKPYVDPYEKIITGVLEENKQLIPALLGMIGVKMPGTSTVGIAATETEKPVTQEVQVRQKVLNAIGILNKIDPDFANTITMLADFAKSKPDQYKAFIPMLKAQM